MGSLDKMIATLKALGQSVPAIAKEAAPLVVAAVQKTAAAGVDPEGNGAWVPKKEGGRAMANAASHISGQSYGSVIRVALKGPDVFHQYAKKKSEQARRVLPDGSAGLPPQIADAMKLAATRVFDRITKGGR